MTTYPDSAYDLEELLTSLGTGEAVVTVLSERGAPTPVAWTRLRAPLSLMAPAPADVVEDVLARSDLRPRYAEAVDRESAREMLAARLRDVPPPDDATPPPPAPPPRREPEDDPGLLQSPVVKSFLRAAATAAGREITRSLFGTARRRRR